MADSNKRKRATGNAASAGKSRTNKPAAKKTNIVSEAVSPSTSKQHVDEQEVVVHRTASGPSKPAFSVNASEYGARTKQVLTSPKFWRWAGAVAATVLVLLLAWWQWQRSYVATVNGQYIPTTKLQEQLLANNGSQTLENLTQQQLIMQEADKRKVTIADDKIQAELNTFIKSTGGEESYRQSLKEFGISEELLRNQVRVRLTLEKLLADKIKVSSKEVEDYYNANKSELDPESKGIDTVKQSIETQLKEQKLNQESGKFVESLSSNAQTALHLDHASMTFGDFLKAEVFSIPADVVNLFTGKK